MKWCSIDPGMKGAVVIWNDDTISCVVPCSYDEDKMPDASMLKLFSIEKIKCVVIEKTMGITGQSAVAAYNFGLGCGCWYGAVKALNIKLVTFTPGYWTRIAHKGLLKKDSTKERSRQIVEKLYPAILELYPNNDGVWDAICIGVVAWKEGMVK